MTKISQNYSYKNNIIIIIVSKTFTYLRFNVGNLERTNKFNTINDLI